MTEERYKKSQERSDQSIGLMPELKHTTGETRRLNTSMTVMSAIDHERQEIREKTERLRKLRLEAAEQQGQSKNK